MMIMMMMMGKRKEMGMQTHTHTHIHPVVGVVRTQAMHIASYVCPP